MSCTIYSDFKNSPVVPPKGNNSWIGLIPDSWSNPIKNNIVNIKTKGIKKGLLANFLLNLIKSASFNEICFLDWIGSNS